MPIINPIEFITLDATGGVRNLPTTDNVVEYRIDAAAPITLLADWTISPVGTPAIFMVYKFKYLAQVTLNGFRINVFGRTLLQNEALSRCEITATWDDINSIWIVDVDMSNNATNDGKVFADSTDTIAHYLSNKVDKSITVNTITHKQELDGDILNPADFTFYGKQGGIKGWYSGLSGIYFVQLTLTHAEILTLNSAPVFFNINPGVGKAIKLIDYASEAKNLSGTFVPYTGNTTIEIFTDTANTAYVHDHQILISTVNRIIEGELQIPVASPAIQYIRNKDLYVTVHGGDPTYGSGDVDNEVIIYLAYRIIQ